MSPSFYRSCRDLAHHQVAKTLQDSYQGDDFSRAVSFAERAFGFSRWRLNSILLTRSISHSFQLLQSSMVDDVPRMQSGGRLEEQNPAFFFGYRTMLHAARHHDKFALFYPLVYPLVAVSKLHPKAAFHNQEHFVFVFMMMEYELALQLV